MGLLAEKVPFFVDLIRKVFILLVKRSYKNALFLFFSSLISIECANHNLRQMYVSEKAGFIAFGDLTGFDDAFSSQGVRQERGNRVRKYRGDPSDSRESFLARAAV